MLSTIFEGIDIVISKLFFTLIIYIISLIVFNIGFFSLANLIFSLFVPVYFLITKLLISTLAKCNYD
jgi:hypothetical protein